MSTSRTYTSLTTLPAASMNDLAQGLLALTTVSVNQTGITTEATVTNLSVTFTVVASRRIKVTCQLFGQNSGVPGGFIARIKESTTVLALGTGWAGAAANDVTLNIVWYLTPSAGSHTYTVTCASAGGTVQLTNATMPALLAVEDIGI